jgi:hypothetical protein
MKKIFTFWILVTASSAAMSEVVTGTDELAHLPYWELHADAMTFRIVQRLPDQTRAYFSGRGFSKDDAEFIASYCVFQNIFTNTAAAGSQHLVQYDASKWLAIYKNKQESPVLREEWKAIWQQRKAKNPQRIAFEWSLLPTRQQYQPADYNWGMMVYKVPHGETFDLKIFWVLDGNEHTATIKNLQCAKDVYIPPPAEQ